MHWRLKQGLERFATASRPLNFHATPGIGETTWKTLMQKGYIEPAVDSNDEWWRVPHRITDAGRAALQPEAV
jgi:hypothetical protein